MKLSNLKMGGGRKISFTDLFYQHIMFRESCGKCHFANTRRPSDITLGDFWGWEKTDPTFNKDDKGVSLVLINTEKGRKLFKAVEDRMTIFPVKLEDCLQPNLQHPSVMNPKYEDFRLDYEKEGFEYVLRKYCRKTRVNLLSRVLRTARRFAKKII